VPAVDIHRPVLVAAPGAGRQTVHMAPAACRRFDQREDVIMSKGWRLHVDGSRPWAGYCKKPPNAH